VKQIASWVTPVPGGVGPVTVAMLMRNAITAHEKQLAAGGWISEASGYRPRASGLGQAGRRSGIGVAGSRGTRPTSCRG
jgi:hypothetical protein